MGKAVAFAAFLLLFVHGHAKADFAGGRDAFLEGRFHSAFEIFQSSAQAGDAKSQIGLGLLLTWGKGTAKNFFEAYQWFDRVATGSEPVHPVIRIVARTNRDYLANRMSVAMRADAATIAALSAMHDNEAPDSETPIAIAATGPAASLGRSDATLPPNLTTLAAVE